MRNGSAPRVSMGWSVGICLNMPGSSVNLLSSPRGPRLLPATAGRDADLLRARTWSVKGCRSQSKCFKIEQKKKKEKKCNFYLFLYNKSDLICEYQCVFSIFCDPDMNFHHWRKMRQITGHQKSPNQLRNQTQTAKTAFQCFFFIIIIVFC